MKTSEQIIEEIERIISVHMHNADQFRGTKFFEQSKTAQGQFENLLSWITQENNLDGLADD